MSTLILDVEIDQDLDLSTPPVCASPQPAIVLPNAPPAGIRMSWRIEPHSLVARWVVDR